MTGKVYTIEEIKKIINEHRNELEKNYNAENFFLFGSYARGEQDAESDLDFLIEFKESIGLMKLAKLKFYLEELFEKNIDVGTPEGLKRFIRNKVLKEAIKI